MSYRYMKAREPIEFSFSLSLGDQLIENSSVKTAIEWVGMEAQKWEAQTPATQFDLMSAAKEEWLAKYLESDWKVKPNEDLWQTRSPPLRT